MNVSQGRAAIAHITRADSAAPAFVRSRFATAQARQCRFAVRCCRDQRSSDEDLRQENEATIRWTAVADELRSLLQEILQANTQRRQRVGLAALQTYKICEQLARDETHATRLAAHIGEMKKLNKFGRSRRKAPQPDPQPTPQP
jgi:hypothetical protein